jgi:autotransporter-associated beta strand protein
MNGGATLGGTPGWTLFDDSSSASHGTFTNNGPTVQGTFGEGATIFNKSATASNGTFINNGGTVSSQFGGDQGLTAFNDTSTAANGIFTNNAGTVSGAHGGTTAFNGSATAANAAITNYGATVNGASGGVTSFGGVFSTPTAGDATIINNGAGVTGATGGTTQFAGFFSSKHFYGNATAGNATIITNGGTAAGANGGETRFITEFHTPQEVGRSTAANATLIANSGTNGGQGGAIFFQGFSTGGTSRVEVFGNGFLDISEHDGLGITVGSIEGDGNVFLGSKNLTVGTNDRNTTFSGVIQDDGQNGGAGGSLTKIGTGTLDLAGANTYTGNTNVNAGVLKIDGSVTSNTFVNRHGTLAGTGTINGDVSVKLHGNIAPGDAPGTMTVTNYTQEAGGTLLIDIAGTSTGQFSVLNVLGAANLNGFLDPVLLNGFVPSIGDSFTFLDYSAVSGKLFIFDRNIDDAMEHWDITYQANNAILSVAAGNVPVPDQGLTLLLLTLSLLGLVTYRHSLSRKRA